MVEEEAKLPFFALYFQSVLLKIRMLVLVVVIVVSAEDEEVDEEAVSALSALLDLPHPSADHHPQLALEAVEVVEAFEAHYCCSFQNAVSC